MIKIYKTLTCPKCRVLCAKLDQKGIQYDTCTDLETMNRLGIQSVPVLEVDGQLYNFTEANKWINEVSK